MHDVSRLECLHDLSLAVLDRCQHSLWKRFGDCHLLSVEPIHGHCALTDDLRDLSWPDQKFVG
jgi:hypothetical protein